MWMLAISCHTLNAIWIKQYHSRAFCRRCHFSVLFLLADTWGRKKVLSTAAVLIRTHLATQKRIQKDFIIFYDCCGHKRYQYFCHLCGDTRGKLATLYLWFLPLDMAHLCGKYSSIPQYNRFNSSRINIRDNKFFSSSS